MTSTGARCGDRLVAEKEDLARAITDALYAERPELLARYGAAGREKCLQDMRYNLEHLAPAVALDQPAMFAGYAQWLAGLLGARGIPLEDVVRSLVLTREAIAHRFTREQAAAAEAAIAAGLAALDAAGGSRA
jgi:hypothetical protein